MKVREARKRMVSALREKPEGLTRNEIQERFPDLAYERVDRLLMFFYDRYVVGYDCVTDSRRPRWIA